MPIGFLLRISQQLRSILTTLQEKTQEQDFFLERFGYILLMLPITVLYVFFYCVSLLFLSPQDSFQYLHQLAPEKVYTVSYSEHYSWHRGMQVGAFLTTLIAVFFATASGTFYTRDSLRASSDLSNSTVTCSGSATSPTIVNASTYTDESDLILNGSGFCQIYGALRVHTLTLNDSVTFSHAAGDVTGLNITAQEMTIGAQAILLADGKGCQGAASVNKSDGAQKGYGPHETTGICMQGGAGSGLTERGGAAHGGHGGSGTDGTSTQETTYGSQVQPALLGAGGASGESNNTTAGAGGGLIRLTIADSLRVQGMITADGTDAANTAQGAGGGSGGSIWISAQRITGSGTVRARGGNGTKEGGGGGGGRIALYYDELDAFTTTQVNVNGGLKGSSGKGTQTNGTAGTTVFFQYGVPTIPSVISPVADAGDLSLQPELMFSQYEGNGRPHLTTDVQISRTQEFSDNCTGAQLAFCVFNHEKTETLTVDTPLAAGTTYAVRVRYTNLVGSSAWSDPVTFTTIEAPVSVVDPEPVVESEESTPEPVESVESELSEPEEEALPEEEIETQAEVGTPEPELEPEPQPEFESKEEEVTEVEQAPIEDEPVQSVEAPSLPDIAEAPEEPAPIVRNTAAPTLTLEKEYTVKEGDILKFEITAADADSDTLFLSVAEEEFAKLFLDHGNGNATVQWEPAYSKSGSYDLTVEASDGKNTTTRQTTIIVENVNRAPQFKGDLTSRSADLPSFAFIAGIASTSVMTLSDYFVDPDGDAMTFAVEGNANITVDIDDKGAVSFTAEDDYAGTEQIQFIATDTSGASATSNSITVIVSEAVEQEAPSEVVAVRGTTKGKGMIETLDAEGNVVAAWQAFETGGVIPHLISSNGTTYVVAMSKQAGTLLVVYSVKGDELKRSRLSRSSFARKIAIGQLTTQNEEQIVIVTEQKKKLYFQVFRFEPVTRRILGIKNARYSKRIKSDYTMTVEDQRVVLRNANGKLLLRWKPRIKE